jgi:hypothetical protein
MKNNPMRDMILARFYGMFQQMNHDTENATWFANLGSQQTLSD